MLSWKYTRIKVKNLRKKYIESIRNRSRIPYFEWTKINQTF